MDQVDRIFVLEKEIERILATIKFVDEESRKNPGPGWDTPRQLLQNALEARSSELSRLRS
ncbi:hypothetical protein [Tateyamaria sp. SN3-11]|uniref:hypothetical protein n=1 Tax=Tateyamaria sp. SN3-11 TaxID=3092147 RepID=UPI0039EC65A5